MNFSIFKVYQIENEDVQLNLQINLKNEKDFKFTLQFKNKLEIDGFPSIIINPNFSFETIDSNENKVKIDFNMTHEIVNFKSDQESNIESPIEEPINDSESNVVSDVQQNLNIENITLSREDELDNISEEFRDEIDKKFNHNDDNENKQLVEVITNFNKHLDYIMLKLESGEKFGNQIHESDKEITPHPPKEIKPHPPKEIIPHPPKEIIPHPPKEIIPHPHPKEIKPHPPQEIIPHPPQEIKPHPPQEIKPHPPKEITPHPPQEIIPHHPKEIIAHPPQEIENIPHHNKNKKINDVINEIQKSNLCNNVENNLIEIIIKHMTSIECYNMVGEEKKNLVMNSIESILLRNDNKNKNILLILSSKLIDTFIAFDKHKINIEDRNNYLSCFGCR